MKKILTTAVFAMALALVANAYDKTVSTFEDGAAEAAGNFYFSEAPTVITETPNYSTYLGLLPSETTASSTKYLEVSTDTALLRKANSAGTAETVTDNFYIDMMAKFNETESAVMDDSDKLALYMNVDGKLVVVAGESKTVCVTTKPLTANTWYRVIIRMIGNIYASGDSRPGFVVSINGEDVSATPESYVTISGSLTPTAQEYYSARKLFPSILTTPSIQYLALTGVGSVDDIVFTDKRNADSAVEKPAEWTDVAAADVTYTVVDSEGSPVAGVTPKTVDYSTLDTGVYSVQASATGKDDTLVGDPIGVMEFTNLEAGKQKLISVPWMSADKKNVRVADMFVGAVNNDVVAFYDNGAYRNYTYTDGVWTPDGKTIAAGYTTDSVFAPGTAAFYTPVTTHSIKLVGIAQTSTEKAPEAGVNAWSALGSTVVTNTPVANILANVPESAKATGTSGSTAKDKIAVQQPNGSFKYYFIGSDGALKVFPFGTAPKATDVIPGGAGFMYFSTGENVPAVKFGN